jgi:hypothetical protein
MKKKTAEALGNGIGGVLFYLLSLGICQLLVLWFDITWERALLFEILWVVTLTRYHQNPEKEEDDE